MKTLNIDIETFSSTDLIKSGVYAYAEAPDFEILLFAYSVDGAPVQVVDLAQGGALPPAIYIALTDPAVQKVAYNANFERTCIAAHFGIKQPPEQWKCSSVDATRLGLPGYLDGVAQALKLDVQKDSTGKALIRYFSMPCKPTKVNGGRIRNYPEHDPEKWQQYIEYNRRDVEVELAIRQKIDTVLEVSKFEQDLWTLDQHINDRGVQVDQVLVDQAMRCDLEYADELMEQSRELTGLANPNSIAQLTGWLQERGVNPPNMQAETVDELIQTADDDLAKQVLLNRRQLSKASVKKYQAMERSVCSDGRIRGLLQFYGAGRTGRWAGRLVQVQNLTKNYLPDIENARNLIKSGEFGALDYLFKETRSGLLSQLVRTALVASPGHRLIVSDFSAIEARVIAWFAQEKWRLRVFETHGKIYEASAAEMFNVPIESIDKGSPLRQKGKVSELALGYQGGPGALITMGALENGLTEEELPGLVKAWRKASPNIVNFWWACNRAAIEAIQDRTAVKTHGVTFRCSKGVLTIELPSGRKLAYMSPKIVEGRFGQPAIQFMGVDSMSKKWTKIETYGGKLVENIVQATARDCLAESLIKADKAGYKQVMHVHDELVADMPYGEGSLADLEELMSEPIEWAPGLTLTAEGFETEFYMKD